MDEDIVYECDRSRLKWVLAGFLFLAVMLSLFAWNLNEPESSDRFSPKPFVYVYAGMFVLGAALLALTSDTKYVIKGATILTFSPLRKRVIDLSGLVRPLVVPRVFARNDWPVILTRKRLVHLNQTTNNEKFWIHLKSLLPPTVVHLVPTRAVYRGLWWMHLGAMILFLVFPLWFFSSAYFELGPKVLPLFPRFIPFFIPFLIAALVYGLLAFKVKVVRSGDQMIAYNAIGKVTRKWHIDASEYRFDGPFTRPRCVGKNGEFSPQFAMGADRKLMYDVFAISSGNYEFVDE